MDKIIIKKLRQTKIQAARLQKLAAAAWKSLGLAPRLYTLSEKNAQFKKIRRALVSLGKYRLLKDTRVRLVFGLGTVLLLLTLVEPLIHPAYSYALGTADSLLTPISQPMAAKLKYDAKAQAFNFNQDYSPANSSTLTSAGTQVTAVAHANASQGVQVTDTVNKINFTLSPKFGLGQGRQDGNRIVYPLAGGNGWAVFTMHSIGVKEDLVLSKSSRDTATFDYKLGINSGLSARLERDGSIGVYGNTLLSGSVTTGSAKDAALLAKARQNAPKNTLLFSLPAPSIKELGKNKTSVHASYSLKGDDLSVNISGLSKAHYPLDIDPSIYVASAQQFMNGNNETNIDFDVADQLIEKGQTTGARFDSWNATRNLNNAIWQQGVAVAGGFIYTVGGNYPNGAATVYNTQGSDTYTVPAGFNTITFKAWGGGGGGAGGGRSGSGGNGGGSGYVRTVLSVTPGEVLNVMVGGGGGGGTGRSDGGDGGGGGGYSSISHSGSVLALAAGGAGGGGGGYNSGTNGGNGGAGGGTTGISGDTASGNSGGGGGTQSSGGSAGSGGGNSGSGGSSLAGGGGADGRSGSGSDGSTSNGATSGSGGSGGLGSVSNNYAGGGGGGGGYYGGGGGSGSDSRTAGSGGGGGSSYSSGSSTTNTAGSGQTPGNSGDADNNGAGDGGGGGGTHSSGSAGSNGLIVITAGTGSTNTSDVTWAQFNTASGSIDSANPGSGTCGGWCTASAYSLPAARSSLSLVAYNGFLYAIGGEDTSCTSGNGTGDGGICSTVYVAKLGANGEPQLWSPTSTDRSTWSFWYRDANLSSPRSMIATVAYNGRIYLMGGKTSSGGTLSVANTTQVADITATGKLGSWSTQTALPYADYGYGAQVYNDRLYLIGGASSVGGAPLANVYYNNINADGSLNSWIQTSSLTGGRMTEGGNFTASWGGYIYLSGGCTSAYATNGYCTSMASDTQLASINADGSLDNWITDAAVADGRMGHNIVAWRNYIYEIGGCTLQNSSTGACQSPLNTINYGSINQDGDVSLISSSVSSGTSPCSGGSPYNCNLPPAGSNNGQGGQMLGATAIINGYLYVAGGCRTTSCNRTSNNTSYIAVSTNGTLSEPANCTADGNTLYGAWCVDNTHNIQVGGSTTGVAAAGTAVFGKYLYIIGGMDGTGNNNEIFYTTTNDDGSLNAWTTQSMTGVGATSVSYDYAYIRSNPGAASTAPANLFIFGGCSSSNTANCTAYTDAVYKCDINSDGSVANCSTSGQLQIGTVSGGSGVGLAGMGGTVYANYVYLIGGTAPGQTSGLATIRYAKLDNSNNVVSVSGSNWIESANQLASARQLASGFGYNGYIYVMGGYSSSGSVLNDIEFAKINVSDGSINSFVTSSVTINSRWGLRTPVSNSYAYIIGGCQSGSAPTGCSSMQATVDVVEIYNNDSGAPAGYTTAAHTYGTNPNRLGASATVLNGYIYMAGGCTSTTDCTSATTNVSYAQIDAQGNVGTWANTSATLPAARVWGKLEAAGGTLYYIGGQDSSGTAQTAVYYGTPSSGNVTAWSTASNGLPQARTNFGAAVWNNRLYVIGGVNGSGGTSSYSTVGAHNFVVPSGITTVTVKAWGAGGGGAGGGYYSSGGAGGGGGFAQSTLSVTTGETLNITVGGGGGRGNFSSGSYGDYAGDGGGGGGYSSVYNGSTPLILAAGGGGGGSSYDSTPGAGGAGGGASGVDGGDGGSGNGGSGGSQSAGGNRGTGGNNGTSGSSLAGGNGADGGGSSQGGMSNGGSSGGGNGGIGDDGNYGYGGAGGGGGGYYGGGGAGAPSSYSSGAGGGGGGSSYTSGSNPVNTAGSGQAPGNSTDPDIGSAAQGGNSGGTRGNGSAGAAGEVVISYGSTSSLYISPQLNSGGNITSAWTSSSSSINAPRSGLSAVAYANNLYILGGSDGADYYSDSQYAQINSADGSVGSWSYSTSLPRPLSQGDAFAANGYIYMVGGRSGATSCSPVTLVAPISANTAVASGNHPTGVGTWYAANQQYSGDRYGNSAVYYKGKAYVLGGACGSTLSYASPVVQQTTLLSQPQVAKYSIMIDTDNDVFPNEWLLNGVDNSIGAKWQLNYRSMTNTTTACTSPAMTTWGLNTNFGDVTLGTPGAYIPKDGSGSDTNCARFFFFNVSVDSSQAFGYPDDVTRGPTITDLTLQYTANASTRLMHGRSFSGGLQQPDDTPYYTH